jgi:hypothetical protein
VPTPSSATLIGSTSEFLFVNNVAMLGITLDLASFETAVSDPIQNFTDKSFAFADGTASVFEAGNIRFSLTPVIPDRVADQKSERAARLEAHRRTHRPADEEVNFPQVSLHHQPG